MMETLKRVTGVIVKFVQKILIFICLVLLYIIGLGLTYPLVYLFSRRRLVPAGPVDNSYWLEAEGYEASMEECERES